MNDDTGPIRVLIVAGDPLARAGLAALLVDAPGCVVAGQADSGALDEALSVYRPDVLLWDAGWDSGPDSGPDQWPDLDGIALPVVVLVAGPGADMPGTVGVLLRSAGADRLGAALAAAAHGLIVLDPALANAARHSPAPVSTADLTPREIEVVTLLAEGLANRAIAARLGISEHTVKFHLNAILVKFGAQSRTEAVVQAIRLGLIAV